MMIRPKLVARILIEMLGDVVEQWLASFPAKTVFMCLTLPQGRYFFTN